MNKVLVTGLALLTEADKGKCSLCKYDFSWVFNFPSTLLWTDKIVLTPGILQIIQKEEYPEDKLLAKVLKIFFSVAGENELIEIMNPIGVLSESIKSNISQQVQKDRADLAKRYPKHVKLGKNIRVPGELSIEDFHFCSAWVEEIYFSLFLSRIWKSNLLLNDSSKTYLKYRLGVEKSNKHSSDRKANSLAKIFDSFIPEINIYPPLFDERCVKCGRLRGCQDKEILTIEKAIKSYIKFRDYDELQELKEVIAKISQEAERSDIKTSEIVSQFQCYERKVRKRMLNTFPKVKRWTKLITAMSVPVVVAGITTQNPLIGGIGAGIGGVSTVLGNYIDILQSKQRWVLFNQSEID